MIVFIVYKWLKNAVLSQDHGTFNSWDRQPFWNATGAESYAYDYREIYNNLWINNYNPQEATDNDDGMRKTVVERHLSTINAIFLPRQAGTNIGKALKKDYRFLRFRVLQNPR
eukprot:COSAG06_NODE_4478_length_4214_cov_3.940948_1_plen_113_part_00